MIFLYSFIHLFMHRTQYLLSPNSVSGIVAITMNKTKFQLSGRVCQIVPPSFYNSYFNDYKCTQKKVLMAGTFIIPKRQKALGQKWTKGRKGGWAQFLLIFLTSFTQTHWEEISRCHSTCPLTPGLCHPITLPLVTYIPQMMTPVLVMNCLYWDMCSGQVPKGCNYYSIWGSITS